MKKLLLTVLVIILAVSMMTACGGKSGGNDNGGKSGGDSSSSPSASDSGSGDSSSSPSASDSGSGDSSAGAKEPGGIRTPDITVSIDDVVFDNDIFKLTFVDVRESSGFLFITCKGETKPGQAITIKRNAEPIVINGSATDIVDIGFTNLKPVESGGTTTGDVPVMIDVSDLEKAGFSVGDIKTVQVTFSVVPIDDFKKVIFEGTVLFNI